MVIIPGTNPESGALEAEAHRERLRETPMPLHEAVAPAIPTRPDAGRSPARIPGLSPALASIAVGAFAIPDDQFEGALAELRRELAPSNMLESILVALLVEA